MKIIPPPGPERRRQLALLVVAVVALGAVLWSQRPQSAPTVPGAASSTSRASAGDATEPLPLPSTLRLAALERVPDREEVGRNPFTFGARPVPAPVRPPVSFTPASPVGPPPPVVPSGPPPIRLVFTGMVVIPDTGRTMVTLRDPGTGASFRAFEGDVLDGRYRVLKVGPRSVTVSYLDGSGQRTIPLGS